MEQRKTSFYSKEIDMERVEEVLHDVISTLNFTEVCKMFREICYGQIFYHDEERKGIVYKGGYEERNIEQANRLQQNVSIAVSLYCQSIVDKNVFNEDYLKGRIST